MPKAAATEFQESEEWHAHALAAKRKLCADYLMVTQAMRDCAASVEKFAGFISATSSNSDLTRLLEDGGLPPPLGSGVISSASAGKSKTKREGDDADDKPGKKKRVVKEKDPNAPKRPPSAYILFQNDVRAEMKSNQAEGSTYKELLTSIGDAWKNLDEAQKAAYNEKANSAMSAWREENKAYEDSKKSPDQSAMDVVVSEQEPEAEISTIVEEPKKEKKKKKKAAKE